MLSWLLRLATVLVLVLACGGGGGKGKKKKGAKAKAGVEAKYQGDARVVVLAFDGVDPDWVDTWRTNMKATDKLLGATNAKRLKTTVPPASPVVWRTMATSLSAHSHGVFGHLVRDPLSFLPRPGAQWYVPPVFSGDGTMDAPPKMESIGVGDPFWEVAARTGVPTKVLFAPYVNPLPQIDGLSIVAGEGSVDLAGTWGNYTVLDTQPDPKAEARRGAVVPFKRTGEDKLTGHFLGPRGPGGRPVQVPVALVTDDNGRQRIQIGQDEIEVRIGEFSKWKKHSFKVGRETFSGLVRFYLVSREPRTQLYVSPVIMDPEDPVLPLSSPPEYMVELREQYGIKPLGWEHETLAVSDGVVPGEVFAHDRSGIMKRRRKALLGELDKGDAQLLVAFIHDVDRVWHLFLSQTDRVSPAYDDQTARLYGGMMKEAYFDMDRLVGDVLDKLGPNDKLIVMSGNGFHPWSYNVDLNRFLIEEEYLVLSPTAGKPPSVSRVPGEEEGTWVSDMDLEATRAFSTAGPNIYLSIEGRDQGGVIPADEVATVVEEMATALKDLRHNKGRPVTSVTSRIGKKTDPLEPDLIVGFSEGYGVSRDTLAGQVGTKVVVRNPELWAADHATNAASVTDGFVTGNFNPIPVQGDLRDVAPTVLTLLGVAVPTEYEGRSWVRPKKKKKK